MALGSINFRNMTASPITLGDLGGIVVPASGQLDDVQLMFGIEQLRLSSELYNAVLAGDIEIDDYTNDSAIPFLINTAKVEWVKSQLGAPGIIGGSGLIIESGSYGRYSLQSRLENIASYAGSLGDRYWYWNDTAGDFQLVDANTTRTNLNLYSKSEVDLLLQGIAWKQPVRIATTSSIADLSNVTVTNFQGQGVTLVAGDRVLVKNTASPDGIVPVSGAYNGIYVVGTVTLGAAAFTRADDASTGTELLASACIVNEGTVADSGWVCTTNAPITIDSTVLTYVQFTSISSLPTGTTTNSTLRWNGTAWVENTAVLTDASGTFNLTGTAFLYEGNNVTFSALSTNNFEATGYGSFLFEGQTIDIRATNGGGSDITIQNNYGGTFPTTGTALASKAIVIKNTVGKDIMIASGRNSNFIKLWGSNANIDAEFGGSVKIGGYLAGGTPQAGTLRWNTGNTKLEVHDGTAWNPLNIKAPYNFDFNSAGAVANNTTVFINFLTRASNTQPAIAPYAGVIEYMTIQRAPGANSTTTYRIFVNGVSVYTTTLTGTNLTGVVLPNVTIAAGDTVSIQVQTANGGGSINWAQVSVFVRG